MNKFESLVNARLFLFSVINMVNRLDIFSGVLLLISAF